VLVVLTGLPGTGKSAIAEAVATELAAPVFSVDPLEATLLRLGITREQRSDRAAYALAHTLADGQLARGQSVVIDAVNGVPAVRDEWEALARRWDAPLVWIKTICSDEAVHRARVESRNRGIEGFVHEPTWDDAEQVRATWYEPFAGEALVLDAVDPLEDNITRALDRLMAR